MRNISAMGSNEILFEAIKPTGMFYESEADIDGDGKLDMIGYGNVYRNTSTSGSISYAPSVKMAGVKSIDLPIIYKDIDGDGKIDLLITDPDSGDGSITIFRNTTTPGNISTNAFSSPLKTIGPMRSVMVQDIDGDNKPELWVGLNVLDKLSSSTFLAEKIRWAGTSRFKLD
ncbi:MAG: VCBS repeat-containing protein [Proteobacteria bacterium]|nr:MAG: VCBS repeat-containing protein [Pseudomonadota bacterium]